MVELQKAKERNERLDTEIRVLRDRVRSLDSERKALLKLVSSYLNILSAAIFKKSLTDYVFSQSTCFIFRYSYTLGFF